MGSITVIITKTNIIEQVMSSITEIITETNIIEQG